MKKQNKTPLLQDPVLPVTTHKRKRKFGDRIKKLAEAPAEPQVNYDNRLKAIVYMNIFTLSQAVLNVIYKFYLYPGGVGAVEYAFWRNIWFFICCYLLSLYYRVNWRNTNEKENALFLAGFLGLLFSMLMMLSLQVNTLSMHTIILLTSPFWASLLAYLLNGERIEKIDMIAIGLCFLGVIGCAFAIGIVRGSSSGILISFAMAWAYSACNIFNR